MSNLVLVDQLKQLDPVKPEAKGRVVFAMDATASRGGSWRAAQVHQSRMFLNSNGLTMKLMYYRGEKELQAGPWLTSPEAMTTLMRKVHCVGGFTQIGRTIKHAGRINAEWPIAGLMFVGDAFEEDLEQVLRIAKASKVKCFMFQEGTDREAEDAFRAIARATGGAYAKFGNPSQMSAAMVSIAKYATGTLSAPAEPPSGPTYQLPSK